ncbi:DNA/RNA non-specific endonuclease [Butyrivibrio sp. YAB3001]|uniref:DNA/RNA non-specific endonuclease n=1 Tax=Butyrivibrio sp. YAB3001 TaxID=1520812 RepID=UPI0008F679C8|nr:DNA/RNA non-specific endonuclease [Butyrivibrio sp. YAB3001]SFC27854.1 DNA-entry nuclease [Butyrivibrio sp. YAB3001]
MRTCLGKVGFANTIFALLLALSLGMSSFLFCNVKTHAEEEIPSYSGSASVELNENVPEFTADEITTNSYEYYGDLDDKGRCTLAMACLGKDLMPTKERQSISMVKPTGWKQNKYPGLVDSDPPYLYNRCHMIGFQLTGENANEQNLITGTRYMNVEGMLPYENEVADYVRSTGNHVMYRVIPVFEDKNLLCSGVQIEGYSVEDKGKGISFNVYCYNVQPGVIINYTNGSNKADPNYKKSVSADEFVVTGDNIGTSVDRSAPAQSDTTVPAGTTYVVNKNSKKFHNPSCDSVKDMKEKNKMYYEGTRAALIQQGYDPCKRCNP